MVPHTMPSNTLAPDEKEKVSIDNNTKVIRITKRDKQGNVKQSVVGDGGRKAEIVINKDGTVSVTSQTHGFIFEPGISAFVSDKPRIGLDVQWAYWHRWSLSFGAGTEGRTIDGYGAVNYLLPFNSFSNTSVFAGYSARKQIVLGIRVKF